MRKIIPLFAVVFSLAPAQEKIALLENHFVAGDSTHSSLAVIHWLQNRRAVVRKVTFRKAVAFSIEGTTYTLRFDSLGSGRKNQRALLSLSAPTSDPSRRIRIIRDSSRSDTLPSAEYTVASWLSPSSAGIQSGLSSGLWGWEFSRHTLTISVSSIRRDARDPAVVIRLVYSDIVDWPRDRRN